MVPSVSTKGFTNFASNEIPDARSKFSAIRFSKTLSDWPSILVFDLGLICTAWVKVVFVLSSQSKSKEINFLLESSGFWLNGFGFGFGVVNFCVLRLLRVGVLGESWLLFCLTGLEAV